MRIVAFWCFVMAAFVALAYLSQGCGDTIVNNFYGNPDAGDDAWVEPDESSSPDLFVDETEPAPPEDVEEEWAPGCNPPMWMIDPGWATCEINEHFIVDFCQLVWDKGSCTASCWDDNKPPDYVFQNATPEAVSAPSPEGRGCSPTY